MKPLIIVEIIVIGINSNINYYLKQFLILGLIKLSMPLMLSGQDNLFTHQFKDYFYLLLVD